MLTFKKAISPIRLVFFSAIAVLGILTVLSYRENLQLIQKATWVNHTNVVRYHLQSSASLIKDAETGARAFYLTGDSSYLGEFTGARTELPAAFASLDSLVADNDKQMANLRILEQLTQRKLFFLSRLTDKSASPLKDVSLLHLSREEMDDIRQRISLMQSEEDRLLRLRTTRLNNAVMFAPVINLLLACTAIILLVISYFKILTELERSTDLQNDLRESNEILEKSNSELAQFAYVASHDLQEPLRKIQTFISRIHDTETGLSPKGRDYFERVNSSARRMQQLIRDILSYSRVDNRDNRPERTDLAVCVAAAKEQLDEFINERKAEIRCGKLPTVNVVRYQFDQLFQNLLSNALKFAQPGMPSVITISADLVKGETIKNFAANRFGMFHRIRVSDNGIGFEQQYGERIFKIFHRLNSKEAYDGNGIGLSIVKKIMEAHNGFVAAEGTEGVGADFILYLPV